jgi:rhomboid protease GluP
VSDPLEPRAPWLSPELLAPLEHPLWGHIASEDDHPVLRAVREPQALVTALATDESGAITFVSTPAATRLQTVYQPPELAAAVILRDDRLAGRLFTKAAKTCALLLVVALAAPWLLGLLPQRDLGWLLILALIGGVRLYEDGPQLAWQAWRSRRQMREVPERYRQQRDAALRFSLWRGKARRPVTIALALCLGLCFLGQYAIGFERSFLAAGLIKPLLAAGEWWRLATAAMLHVNLMHLAFNGLALLSFGALLEPLLGGGRLLLVFLLGAIGGNLMSWWLMPTVPSVGASGALLAFGGCLLGCALLRPELRQVGLVAGLLRWTILIAIIGLIAHQFIDNACHLGGWLSGAALAPLLVPRRADAYPPRGGAILLVLGALPLLALTAWTGWCLWRANA